MKCARCNRPIRRPGTDVVIGGVSFVFGPVCAAKFSGKRKKLPDPFNRRVRARRADQPDLFEVAA